MDMIYLKYGLLIVASILSVLLFIRKKYRLGVCLGLLIVSIFWVIRPSAHHKPPRYPPYNPDRVTISDERYVLPDLPEDLRVKQRAYEEVYADYEKKLSRHEVLSRERYYSARHEGHKYSSYIFNDLHWFDRYKLLTCEECWDWCMSFDASMVSVEEWEGIMIHEKKDRILSRLGGNPNVWFYDSSSKLRPWKPLSGFDLAYWLDYDAGCSMYSAKHDSILPVSEVLELTRKMTCLCVAD